MKYLYFSRKWTHKNDAFLTFWGSESSGYSWWLQDIGVYKNRDDQQDVYPDHPVKNVSREDALSLFELFIYDGRLVSAIANTPENRKKLGLKKKDCQRLHMSCQLAQIDNLRKLKVKDGLCRVRCEGGRVYNVEGVETFSIVSQSGALSSVRSLNLV